MLRLLPLVLLFACKNASETPTAAAPKAEPVDAAGGEGAAPKAATGNPGQAIATWNGGTIAQGDLDKQMEAQLARMESDYLTERYQNQQQFLDEQVNEAILKLEATKVGKASPEELLRAEVDDKITAPTEAEVQEAYQILARKFGGAPLDQVRPEIEKRVRQKKMQERYMAYLGELRTAYGVKVTLPYPELPRIPVNVDDDPSLGPTNAPVTIVQFAEFQCGYCGKAQETVDQLMKTYDQKIRFVYRDFPLNFHNRAIPAAVAANCAGKQEKFWPYHNALMMNQASLEEADLSRVAQSQGLDMGKWEECRKDPSVTAEVQKDMEAGAAAGVSGTPAFFIGGAPDANGVVRGVFVGGALPYDRFKEIVDAQLQKG